MATDATMQRVVALCADAWPDDINVLPPDVQPYWHSRDLLTLQDGLVLYNARLVIPHSVRQSTLQALHSGHLGIEKCRAKARTSVWWPKIGTDIQRHVSSCQTCLHYAHDRAEPLMSTPLPDLPWQKIGTDIFELHNKHCYD